METGKVLMLKLEVTDARLLAAICDATGQTQTEILRWALRFYAVMGPWPVGQSVLRAEILGPTGPLVVGPFALEVTT